MKKRFRYLAGLLIMPALLLVATGSAAGSKKEPTPDNKPASEELGSHKDPGLYSLLAEEAESQGDAKKVMEYFQKALALDPSSAYLKTRVGSILARNRKLAEALLMAQMAVILDPKYDEAYALQGKIYTVTGSRSRAIEAYSRALDFKPDQKNLYVFLGGLQLSEERLPDAEKTFKRMIKQFPDDREVYFYLEKVYFENQQYDAAIKILEELLSRHADSGAQVHSELGTIYARQKKYEEAEKHLRKAVELDSYNIGARVTLGRVLHQRKRYEEALKEYEEAAKLAPQMMRIQIEMARVLSAQKKHEQAAEILDKILKEKPGLDPVRFELGRVLKEQGKIEEAEQEFSQIPKGSPAYGNSRVMLALMFLKSKDLARAMKYIDEAIDTEPKDPDLFHIRGSVLEELHRYDEAIKTYQKALEDDPKNIRLRYSLGNVYEKSGRRGKALAEMEGILKDKPDDAGALNFIGYTLLVTGQDMDRAEEMIRKAGELEPNDGYIKDSMAWAAFKRGRAEEALALLQEAVKKVDSDPIIYDHLGDVFLALGRKEEAENSYRKSLEMNPENQLVQEKLRKLEQEKHSK